MEVRNTVKCVNSMDAGKWLLIGEFVVEPPFGREQLTLVANSERAELRLPDVEIDNDSGYVTDFGGVSEQ